MRGRQTLVGFAARAHFASPFPITGDLFLIPLFVVGIRIRVVLHICHHPVIQHHIEKYSAFSAKNPPHKQRIRYPQAAKRIFRAADKQIPVHNPVKQPSAPGDTAAFAGRRNGKAEGLARPALHGGAEGFRLDCDIGSVQMEPQAPRSPASPPERPHLLQIDGGSVPGAAPERSPADLDGAKLVRNRTCTNEIHHIPLIKVLRSFFKSDRSPPFPRNIKDPVPQTGPFWGWVSVFWRGRSLLPIRWLPVRRVRLRQR